MLGELEQVVLLAVLRVGKDAYGVPVHPIPGKVRSGTFVRPSALGWY